MRSSLLLTIFLNIFNNSYLFLLLLKILSNIIFKRAQILTIFAFIFKFINIIFIIKRINIISINAINVINDLMNRAMQIREIAEIAITAIIIIIIIIVKIVKVIIEKKKIRI